MYASSFFAKRFTLDLMYPLARALGVGPNDLIENGTVAPYGVMAGTLEGERRLYENFPERHLIPVPNAQASVMQRSDKALVAISSCPGRGVTI